MDNKPEPKRNFQRKATPSARCCIQYQLGMLPIGKLVGGHEELAAFYFTQTNIATACSKLSFGNAHGLTSITASAALVKHQIAKPGT